MKTKTFLAAATVILLAQTHAFSLTQTVYGIPWTYTVSDGNAQIGDGLSPAIPTSTTGAITIPSKLGGLPVTIIGGHAFEECSGLTSLTIHNSVTNIGVWAFSDCKGLTSMTLPDSVTSIPWAAFFGCSGLTSVTIPDSVTKIEWGAFYLCSSLASVTIPNSVTSIGDSAFADCISLASLTIPDSVTSIGDWAFENCRGLTSMTIPNSVTSIGDYLFDDCYGLAKLNLPRRFKGKTDDMGIPKGCKVVFYDPPTTYKVVYNANGGKLPKGKKMAAQTFPYGKAAALRKNTFTRKGYVFLGWAKSKSGAVAYKDAQRVKNLVAAGKRVSLYAKWAKKNYRVKFFANGGKGKMAVEKMTYGKAKELSANKFKRKGYVFKGWAKSMVKAENGKVAYEDKKTVKYLTTTGKTVKLYAVWKKK